MNLPVGRQNRPSLTARYVALARTGMSRPSLPTGDATAEDRLAGSLSTGVFRWLQPRATTHMEARTAFFDREVVYAIGRGIAQIVTIGAGYDGRAWRFRHPGARFFEVDRAGTQADKITRLSELSIDISHVTFIECDVGSGDLGGRLAAGGFNVERAALFVVEGVFSYLNPATVAALLGEVRSLAAAGSRLAANFLSPPAGQSLYVRFRHMTRRMLLRVIGEPWRSQLTGAQVDELLRCAGWSVATEADGPVFYESGAGLFVAAVTTRPACGLLPTAMS